MDTLNTPLAPSLVPPVTSWRSPAGLLHTWWTRLQRSDEDRFLAEATDLADLEERLGHLERFGLPPR